MDSLVKAKSKPRWHKFEVLLNVQFEILDDDDLAENRARFVVGKDIWKMQLSVPARVTKVRAGKVYPCAS